MATTQVMCCDECGLQRGESNHWLGVFESVAPGRQLFTARPVAEIHSDTLIVRTHICGAECLARRQSKWLAAINLNATSPTEPTHDNPDGNGVGRTAD